MSRMTARPVAAFTVLVILKEELMAKIKLRVIPEPAPNTRSVVIPNLGEGEVVMHGDATGRQHVCGQCGRVLMDGIARGNVMDIVIQCPTCGAYNDPTTHDA